MTIHYSKGANKIVGNKKDSEGIDPETILVIDDKNEVLRLSTFMADNMESKPAYGLKLAYKKGFTVELYQDRASADPLIRRMQIKSRIGAGLDPLGQETR